MQVLLQIELITFEGLLYDSHTIFNRILLGNQMDYFFANLIGEFDELVNFLGSDLASSVFALELFLLLEQHFNLLIFDFKNFDIVLYR